ncbi:ATP-binding protein [Leptolyngbya sp. GB1-A1]|uniref:hybrid sensor histidine kinase/response regulator n=1 Tax=Leptolyngbya sp. GB1-A1 TaxID=2933908 RepID=UPI0032996B22
MMMGDIRSVLIVDDCLEDRERYCCCLAEDDQHRYEVWQATSGAEGLACCSRQLPDAILLDYVLPDMTGLEFLRQFKNQFKNQFKSKSSSLYLDRHPSSRLNSDSDSYSNSYPDSNPSQSLPIILLLESETTSTGELLHTAIAALKHGAADCLIKCEITAEQLRSIVQQTTAQFAECRQIEREHQETLSQLQQANQARERQVAAQTAELMQTKQQLHQESADRKRAETLLSRSEAEFRVLSEAAPIGIFRIDIMGNCTYVNPRGQAICGYTLEEAMGLGWQRSIHPDDRKQQWSKWRMAMLSRQEYADDIRYVHKDSTVRFARVKTAPIVSSGEIIGHVGTIEDITEAQEIEQIKREFLSIVSHELKTPLASIRGALALLSTGLFDDEPETAQEVLEIAISDTERLVRLVNDLLDLERLESRQIILARQWCDAATLMQRSIDSLLPLAEEEQIFLTFTPLPQQIYVDLDRLIQILVNLLGNAIKFSSPHQRVHLSAALVTIAGNPMIRFQVKDQGRGIPADKLTLIFERFQQVRSTDAQQQDGTGLGLAICRSLVQLHGGQIWAESTLGQGSTFYFTLPLLPQNQSPLNSSRSK